MTPIKNNFICNKCSRCGSCCGAVPLPITRAEEKKIRTYIKENNIPYQPSYLWKDKDGNLNDELRCVFYDVDKKACKIYKVRPSICRTFRCNMTPEEIERNKIRHHKRAYWNHVDKNGMKHLTNLSILFYDKYADLFKWFLANFRTEFGIEPNKAVNKIFNMFEEGGIKVDAEFLDKLNQELEEDNERADLL